MASHRSFRDVVPGCPARIATAGVGGPPYDERAAARSTPSAKGLDEGGSAGCHPGGVVQLPSGSVTFLLTDIEGSTPLLRRLGERFLPLLERHEQLLRKVWDEHRGVEFKSEGDALLVAFESAAN